MADDNDQINELGAAEDDSRPNVSVHSFMLTDRDVQCPICMSLLVDPFVTSCGHTFCYSCISTHLKSGNQTCPDCQHGLSQSAVYPNFLLSRVTKRAQASHVRDMNCSPFRALMKICTDVKDELKAKELKHVVDTLSEALGRAEQREKGDTLSLLLHFLHHSRKDKLKQLESLQKELECLETDISNVSQVDFVSSDSHANPDMKTCPGVLEPACPGNDQRVTRGAAGERGPQDEKGYRERSAHGLYPEKPTTSQKKEVRCTTSDEDGGDGDPEDGGHPQEDGSGAVGLRQHSFMSHEGDTVENNVPCCGETFGNHHPTKKRRIASHFEDLQKSYLRMRSDSNVAQGESAMEQPGPLTRGRGGMDASLEDFGKVLSVLSSCSTLRTVATIPRPALGSRSSSSIVSSVEFDRDGSMFATAGVSKRISVFEYASVAGTPGLSVHCPIVELVTRSKLSCLSWNTYMQSHLASTDYEGVLTLWDVSTSSMIQEYEAHSKRIWSVDYCDADPTMLATGSDDCLVRLWSTKAARAVGQLEMKANVCCVKWAPGSTYTLAIGSADHQVYLYDIRQPGSPVTMFSGHRKAVSYVRFCCASELVSASTDSTVRLWDCAQRERGNARESKVVTEYERKFSAHDNERNFVGLSVSDDFIACGSESGKVFVYYKKLSKPVACEKFSDDRGSDDKSFISAVAWRPGTQCLAVANSQGSLKLMELCGGSE